LGIALTTFTTGFAVFAETTGFLTGFFDVSAAFFEITFEGADFLATTVFELVFLTGIVFGMFARC